MRHSLLVFLTSLTIIIITDTTEDIEILSKKLPEQTAFISKVEPRKVKRWMCDSYNATDNLMECRCYGEEFTSVPDNLNRNLQRLTIIDADINVISKNSLQPYRETLLDVTLSNLPFLRVIEWGTFRNIPNLRTIYISQTPKIKTLYHMFQGIVSTNFLSLRIVQTHLHEVPDLSYISSKQIMHMIDLESNKIARLPSNSFKIRAEQVILTNNEITSIENYAFNGSQIAKLNLRGNNKLSRIETYAFKGLNSLQQLDLSETSIKSLPVVGLDEVEVLKIEKTPSMKVIPSLYDFANLKEAHLTHPFHCCAFKYPKEHNPERHKQYEVMIKRACHEDSSIFDTGQNDRFSSRAKRSNDYEDEFVQWGDSLDVASLAIGYESKPDRPGEPVDWTSSANHLKGHRNKSDHSHLSPLVGKTIEHHAAIPIAFDEDIGMFHAKSAEITENNLVSAFCGNLSLKAPLIKCYPEPNALNPCEDIMGSYWLRISVWFVVVLAVLGNLAVIIVVLFSGGEVTVSRFLICNLALADICMGLYLMLIASMDLHSVGTYFNFAFDWQYGLGCQFAGFLTVFASHLSVFTLTIVTLERWVAITYAIHLTRRIHIGAAVKIMVAGWMYSIFISALPLFGVSNYSSTSICLPMEVNTMADRTYLFALVMTNGLAFALIVFCYAQIYLSLGYETRHCSSMGEMTIAKKMALLVFTDFACWAPVAFFSLTALAGYPLIGVTRSKILLVFFYPLNSCANPYLYAIMTAQYRRDFFVLLSRCGFCTKTAQQYTLSTSIPTNHSHPVPLLARSNDRRHSKSNHIDEAYV